MTQAERCHDGSADDVDQDCSPSATSTILAIEQAIERVVDLRAELEGSGAALAVTYSDGAVVAMRFALAALIKRVREDRVITDINNGDAIRIHLGAFATPIYFAPFAGEVRIRSLTNAAPFRPLDQAPFAGFQIPEERAVDLACDLIFSERARELAGTPIAGALLADALCSRDWWHVDTRSSWSIGRSGARSVVAALQGGTRVYPLTGNLRGKWLDYDVLACIESLGWRRHPSGRWGAEFAS